MINSYMKLEDAKKYLASLLMEKACLEYDIELHCWAVFHLNNVQEIEQRLKVICNTISLLRQKFSL